MSEAASSLALVASIALHVGVIAGGMGGLHRGAPSTWLADFWGGKTFEVPDDPSDHGEGDTPSSEDESTNEINVEQSEPSPIAPADLAPPDEGVGRRRPARPGSTARTTLASTAPALARGAGPGGTFGAEESAPGVRDLVRSFVRALPMIASSDPAWSTLPLGAAGSAMVAIAIDDDGKPRVSGALSGPAHLRKLITKTISVMSSGRFGIASSEGLVSEQKVMVSVVLTQQAAPTQDQAVSGGVFALSFEPPDAHNVSHAFFTLASGRRVEVSVRPTAR